MGCSARRQHLGIAKRQAGWSTLARKEGLSNLALSKKYGRQGKPILARAMREEGETDLRWANRRRRIANRERRLAGRK